MILKVLSPSIRLRADPRQRQVQRHDLLLHGERAGGMEDERSVGGKLAERSPAASARSPAERARLRPH